MITSHDLDYPTVDVLAEVAKLNRHSDFRHVSTLVGAVFWKRQIAQDKQAQTWPEFIAWASANGKGLGVNP